MKKSYKYIAMLLTICSFASCVKDFDNNAESAAVNGTPIEFTINEDLTRTLLDLQDGQTITWKDGDQVGLYYRSRISGSTNVDTFVADNVPYRYDAQSGKFLPVGEPAVWDDGKSGDNHSLWIYYPYTKDASAFNKITSSVSSEQTYNVTESANPIVSSGFAGSRIVECEYGQPVEFAPLVQSYAMMRLNITNNTGTDVVINKVVVSNDRKNLAATTTMSLGSFVSKIHCPSINNLATVSKSITVTVENGTLKAGESIDVRMMMLPITLDTDVVPTFTVTVTSDAGIHPSVEFYGGNVPSNGRVAKNILLAPATSDAPVYTIGSVVEGGVLYKIEDSVGYVLYPYASKVAWITAMNGDGTVGISKFSSDGREAVAAMKATEAGIDNYPAAKYCDDLEGDWYLPSENELNALFDAYTANDNPGMSKETPVNFKVTPDQLPEKYLAARSTFDGYIKACAPDGDILNTAANNKNGDGLWSATTADANKSGRYITFGKYSLQRNTTTSNYARCIKRVNLNAMNESTEQTYPAPIAGEEGEYDVYLLIGQSNMAGRGEMLEEDKENIQNVYILNESGAVVPATNPLNIYSSIRKADSVQGIGPGYGFSKTIAQETGRKVLLVVNARGGTNIGAWLKGVSSSIKVGNSTKETSLSFYSEAVRRTLQAMEYGALKGIIWHQGCSDQSNTSYMTQLMNMANDLRSDLGGNVPFIVGQIGDWRSSAKTFNTNIQTISQYLIYSDWISSKGGVPIVTDSSNGQPDLTDPHFNRASQITLGKRYAQKILKMVYNQTYSVENQSALE